MRRHRHFAAGAGETEQVRLERPERPSPLLDTPEQTQTDKRPLTGPRRGLS